jgi:hypothetical protein
VERLRIDRPSGDELVDRGAEPVGSPAVSDQVSSPAKRPPMSFQSAPGLSMERQVVATARRATGHA